MSTHMSQKYLTAEQMAEKIGIKRHTVYLCASRGILPPGVSFSSRCRRWSSESIERFIDERRAASGLPRRRHGGGRPRSR